jgi:hypothetical protein
MAAAGVFTSDVGADEPVYEVERWQARHELALAKTELRNYWQVEYPRQQRQLNGAIELTEAEIRDYEERLREYQPFNRFSRGQPFLITIQDLRMCLREAELRLRDLWAERNALRRNHANEWRVLEHKVHEARLRVLEIEAAHEPPQPAITDTSA